MSDANFASLSSTLLARKGGAKPAMRPQSAAQGPVDGVSAAANLEDLGWNDMGEDAPAPSPANFDDADAGEARRFMPKAPTLAETGLIKSGVAEDSEDADLAHDNDAHDHEAASAEIVPIGSRQNNESQSANSVRESLDKIASQLGQQEAGDEVASPTEVRFDAAAAIAAPTKKKKTKPAKRTSAASKGKRAAFTLRLDPERHLMLRLACTVRGSSAQQLVTDALDGLLAEMPEIASLAAQVQQRSH
ncbi:hypothetical protein K3163_03235 [Qipengyuania sp. 1NDW9]|uniref:hypothetical protein n=1 Tax=Qipengyuania xiapuensis TaxID=2867236 RepID=UPI001C8779A0|nr:hypothetical protein [Qipengyuania xiapuensis]MBX7492218.1 hypothetical protein [Qipengyuania xiapuensis]